MFAAPDDGEEFLAGENATCVGSEVIEEAEFEQTGGDDFVGAGDVIGVEIDVELVEFEDLAEFGVGFGAPEEKSYAGDEFARAKGLSDVVIGAGFEGGDEVRFATAGGEHDDGETLEQRVLASVGEDLETGDAGKHGVEEQEIGGGLFEGGAAREAVERFSDVEAGFV